MFKELIGVYMVISTALVTGVIVIFAHSYIREIIENQTVIKLLCRHKYEPHDSYYCGGGIQYNFKCKRCGKIISIETVTTDKFDWYKNNYE